MRELMTADKPYWGDRLLHGAIATVVRLRDRLNYNDCQDRACRLVHGEQFYQCYS